MKRGTLLLLVLLALAGLAVAIAAFILHDGLSARAKPSGLESAVARNLRHLSIPSVARAQENPFGASSKVLREARLHFADHCATCHANDGSGDVFLGRGLYPKPPDLRKKETQKLSDGELFWIIENGVRFTGMPAFSGHGMQDDSWKLVLFIRHLSDITPEERAEMESNNPKSPQDREEEQKEEDFLNGTAPKAMSSPDHRRLSDPE
jgi:mono/diheme cytochrome c family protein